MVLMIRWQVCAFANCSIDESAIVSFCPLGDHTGFTQTPIYNLAHGASFRGRYSTSRARSTAECPTSRWGPHGR